MDDPTPEPPAKRPPRRSMLSIIMILIVFYLFVFTALELVGFTFPMPVLTAMFLFIAVPSALLVIGAAYLAYLIRLQMGWGEPTPPSVPAMVSLFVGTTVLVSSFLVVQYPKWRSEGIEEITMTVTTKLEDSVSKSERAALAQNLRIFLEYSTELAEADRDQPELQRQEVQYAFELVTTAATDKSIDRQEFETLNRALREAFPDRITAPAAATAPSGLSER